MPRTIVIADDVTGANDIGIMYAKSGLKTLVYRYEATKQPVYQSCEVLIVDTDSRFDSPKTAYQKVAGALQGVKSEEVHQFINKQCSVFRGNIGAEFDAMLDQLGEEFAVVVLGFPNNGRTTLHSEHYVYGTLLAESQFRQDPVHPMEESNLVEILKKQTHRQVGSIHYEVYDAGEEALKAVLQKARETVNYCVMDVRNNEDLELLAQVLKDEKIICGSSALAEFLAKIQTEQPVVDKQYCVVGSLTPQSLQQVAYMKEKGYPVIELDTRKLFDSTEKEKEYQRILSIAEEAYQKRHFLLLHSLHTPEGVKETKEIALENGISNVEISSIVSKMLADISCAIIEAEQIRKIIVCGGDTSASICARLEIDGMQVLDEIEAGLPTCRSVIAPYYELVLKSGSFGTAGFIEKAVEKLAASESI